jgi:hypothetical protein
MIKVQLFDTTLAQLFSYVVILKIKYKYKSNNIICGPLKKNGIFFFIIMTILFLKNNHFYKEKYQILFFFQKKKNTK